MVESQGAILSALVIRALHLLHDADRLHLECENVLGRSIRRCAVILESEAASERQQAVVELVAQTHGGERRSNEKLETQPRPTVIRRFS